MPTKVKELDNRKDGDRRQCNLCNPRKKKDEISANELWNRRFKGWRLKTPSELAPS